MKPITNKKRQIKVHAQTRIIYKMIEIYDGGIFLKKTKFDFLVKKLFSLTQNI